MLSVGTFRSRTGLICQIEAKHVKIYGRRGSDIIPPGLSHTFDLRYPPWGITFLKINFHLVVPARELNYIMCHCELKNSLKYWQNTSFICNKCAY